MAVQWSPFARAMLAGGRRRIARDRYKRRAAHAFTAPLLCGMRVLVHPSTKTPGHWQATFFGRDGLPWGDCEMADWSALLDHIHGDGVDWRQAEPR